jgi:uncharacterized repeat protein (TIGR01451 family)
MKKILFPLLCFMAPTFINAQAPKSEWLKKFTGNGQGGVLSNSVATDGWGNVYSTGSINLLTDFDPGVDTFFLTPGGIFVSKLDFDGDFVWAKMIGGSTEPHYTHGTSLVVDISGNSYITGQFYNTVDFDPGNGVYKLTASGSSDIFVLKLNASGNFIWARNMGGATNYEGPLALSIAEGDVGLSITLDPSGNVYTTGSFAGKADFDPGSGIFFLTATSPQDLFVSKLDPNGNFVWAKRVGGNIYTAGTSIKTDKSGNIYTSGNFNGTVDFNPDAGSFYQSADTIKRNNFILKLDTSGQFIWAQNFEVNHIQSLMNDYSVSKIALDDFGNIYASGEFTGSVDFDHGASTYFLKASGDQDLYLSKTDTSGNFIWAKNIGGYSENKILSLTLDNSGNVYFTGSFRDSVDFDPGTGISYLNAENDAAFVSKLDSNGNFKWAQCLNACKTGFWGTSIAVDMTRNVFVTGFGSDKMLNINSFIQKLNQDSCANLVLVVDSLINNLCKTAGFASVHASHGRQPYAYEWSTVPPTMDSFATLKSAGIYSIKVTDNNNCSRFKSLMINKPTYSSGFDLTVDLATNVFSPGRKSNIYVSPFNDGCYPVNGGMRLVLDSDVNYNSASPNPDLISGDTLFWNFTGLSYDSKPIKPFINVTSETNLTRRDTLCFDVFITPSIGDSNTKNNIKRYCYPVRNSYDPNIKSVYPAGACKENYALKNEVLTYTVQFQNTGSADAIDIYILDSLDADLDINTLRVVGQSHRPMITEVLPGRVMKFRFDNIHLPDSNTDEKGSHGYVIYEIMPNSGLPNGTIVKGKAGIYFDFNPPVMTNEVKNTLVSTIPSCNVGIEGFPEKLPAIRVYPNPTPGHLTVHLQQSGTVTIYDMVGNLLYEKPCSSGQNNLDISALGNGIYLLKANGAGVRLVKVQ